mmetsp:Transcript_8041/g.17948  ORF Transcript_8041/g.17948 Transcript_8041/m.17948 type:complete len:174 (-) Transcript_8041:2362-2883(-)
MSRGLRPPNFVDVCALVETNGVLENRVAGALCPKTEVPVVDVEVPPNPVAPSAPGVPPNGVGAGVAALELNGEGCVDGAGVDPKGEVDPKGVDEVGAAGVEPKGVDDDGAAAVEPNGDCVDGGAVVKPKQDCDTVEDGAAVAVVEPKGDCDVVGRDDPKVPKPPSEVEAGAAA